MPLNLLHPTPAPPAFGQGKEIPERKSFFLSRLFFSWLDPLLGVGYTRPLEQDDLWDIPHDRLTSVLADKVESAFYARCPPEQRPKRFQDPSAENGTKKYDASVTMALHSVLYKTWWTAGIMQLLGETLKTTTPLVNKVILTWLTDSYIFYRTTEAERTAFGLSNQAPRGVGFGIGLAFAIFVMQEVASLLTNHYSTLAMSAGLWSRASVIGIIFRKSLRLSGKSRAEHTSGQIMTMISTDATRIDHFAMYGHQMWIAPIQIIVGIALLIVNLGYSALVGLGVLILGMPIQGIFAVIMMKQRQKGVKITDARVRLTTEVLQGIRLLKFYNWETFYIDQIAALRKGELDTIKASSIAQAALVACVSFIPLVATVLSFITYSLTGHQLTVATIFTSLQFFNVIRLPLLMLPMVLSGLGQFLVAVQRMNKYLTAEEQADPPTVDFDAKDAIRVEDAEEKAKEEEKPKLKKGKKEAEGDAILPTTVQTDKDNEKEDEEKLVEKQEPFRLKNLNLTISRGSFVAIVGQVGSGKSSILQALIGEMKKTQGKVTFGGSVAYVSQVPWIQNNTIRNNITGGPENLDEERLKQVVKACSLERDLESDTFGDGLDTAIGEKGVNLSGGQKARVSLARAAYASSDIVLLDDPLSAVDSYVGKEILENCILDGPFANRTRVLVTHALHVLDKADYIYVVEDGSVKEEGTYQHLLESGPTFSRLINEYGKQETQLDGPKRLRPIKDVTELDSSEKKAPESTIPADLMQEEERSTGAVTWGTYTKYFRHGGSIAWVPLIVILLALNQSSEVGNNLMLGFWTAMSIPGFDNGEYMALYAGFGIAQAVFTFILTYIFAIIGIYASLSMFKASLKGVLQSPISFFDTNPMGKWRILSRLSKDQDTLDAVLPLTLMQFLLVSASILGTMGLVFYTVPLVGVMFPPTIIIYYAMSTFYRRTSVEVKRLDSLSRSAFYSSYSETLTGLATVRAYRNEGKAINDAESKLDKENRAYYITVTLQRWLSVRLDVFSNLLILGILLAAASNRATINPAKIGVVLSYALPLTEIFAHLITIYASQEQNMNAVERLLVYSTLIPERDEKKVEPAPSWPAKGEISFKNVEFAYREGLPLVLKDVSFHIKSGEKIGVVGRTGAGKSSIIQALFRIAKVNSGTIEIDGEDINNVSLQRLRQGMALVPQDNTLFLGTLRENLDPLHTRTDAELISAMRRSWLLPSDRSGNEEGDSRFSLDSTVGDEGSNFSAGEKQLVALCRALVRSSSILVLDEATSNVDVETDTKLQQAIHTEFAESTIICVAHRLNTIAHYDRILVMDDGKVAEFDGVLQLFDNEDSLFRSLCDEAGLRREDLTRIREAYGHSTPDS